MQVFVELALLENFCMDFTLLYCAKLVSKNPAHVARIAFASVLGACFAVAFPLFGLKGVWASAVKIVSGLIICFLSGKFNSFKAYLIAVFALTGADTESGAGFTLSSVPVGIPLFCALAAVIAARKIAARLKKTDKAEVECKIYFGEKSVSIRGFFDSGNKVSHLGRPVSVIPLTAAMRIVDAECIKDTVKIHTVAGSKKLKIFTADKIEINYGEKANTVKNVKIGISPHGSGVAVLHPDLSED